jgi:predicted aspartyl protease
MSAKEALSEMAGVAREEPDERFTLNLVRLKKRGQEHHLLLPAKTNTHNVHFCIDTGSCHSVISKRFVAQSQIQPCKLKEIPYLSHSVKIIGKASVLLKLSNGRSSLEIV